MKIKINFFFAYCSLLKHEHVHGISFFLALAAINSLIIWGSFVTPSIIPPGYPYSVLVHRKLSFFGSFMSLLKSKTTFYMPGGSL